MHSHHFPPPYRRALFSTGADRDAGPNARGGHAGSAYSGAWRDARVHVVAESAGQCQVHRQRCCRRRRRCRRQRTHGRCGRRWRWWRWWCRRRRSHGDVAGAQAEAAGKSPHRRWGWQRRWRQGHKRAGGQGHVHGHQKGRLDRRPDRAGCVGGIVRLVVVCCLLFLASSSSSSSSSSRRSVPPPPRPPVAQPCVRLLLPHSGSGLRRLACFAGRCTDRRRAFSSGRFRCGPVCWRLQLSAAHVPSH